MSELLQFTIVAAFGGLCFGCGYLIAFIVTRNKWRDEMIRRGVARLVSVIVASPGRPQQRGSRAKS
jgi:ABC-type Fe3+ transport system permease subunit